MPDTQTYPASGPSNPAAMRARFWQLTAEIEALDAANARLVAERDALQAEFEPRLRALNQRVREAQAPRYVLQSEQAALAHALISVGERPA